MRKLVRTPPTSTVVAACLGKPLCSNPTSVVVPPMSSTMASDSPDRNAAPRIELVGPLAKVSTGKRSAMAASMSVPSFCERNTGLKMPQRATPSRSDDTVSLASASSEAFKIDALSRSSSPSWPMEDDSVMVAPGQAAASNSPARRSYSSRTGAKMPATAMVVMPRARISAPIRVISAGSRGRMGVPSKFTPPAARYTCSPTAARRSAASRPWASDIGAAGRHRRTMAVGVRCRRSMTALVKCVVPITRRPTSAGEIAADASTFRSASMRPPVTSEVVGTLTTASTLRWSMTTASVFVPPTSTPIRYMHRPRFEGSMLARQEG